MAVMSCFSVRCGAGHSANLTHSEPVNKAVISFMEVLD
jgi:hypothetical protein